MSSSEALVKAMSIIIRLSEMTDLLLKAQNSFRFNEIRDICEENRELRPQLAEAMRALDGYNPTTTEEGEMIQLAGPLVQKILRGDRLFSVWQGNLGLMVWGGALCAKNTLCNLQPCSKLPSIEELDGAFQGVPAVVVSAGPSLDKNIHLLEGLSDRAIIITINRCASIFEDRGLKPHFMVASDPSHLLPEEHFKGVGPEVLENLVVRLSVHPKLLKLPSKQNWLFTDGSTVEEGFMKRMGLPTRPTGGGSVAHSAFQLAYYMGCDPIVLIGQDLAYSDNKAYSSMDIDGDIELALLEGEEKAEFRNEEGATDRVLGFEATGQFELSKVPAWGGGTVSTSLMLRRFIEFFSLMAPVYRKKTGGTFINATEGGAHIEGFNEMTFKEAIDTYMTKAQADLFAELRELHQAHVASTEPMDVGHELRQLKREMERLQRLSRECEKLACGKKRNQKVIDRITDRHKRIRSIFENYEFFLRDTLRGKQSMEVSDGDFWDVLQKEFRAMRRTVTDLIPPCDEAISSLEEDEASPS